MPIAGEYASLPLLKQDLAAKAIVFEFVNPVHAFGRLIDRGRKLGFNETEPSRYAKHEGYVEVERSPGKCPHAKKLLDALCNAGVC